MPEENEISPQIRNQLMQFDQFRQQAQMISMQRQQMEMKMEENTVAVEVLEAAGDGAPVYRNVGAIMIQTDKKSMLEKINEENEALEVRTKSLKSQEEKVMERLTALQAQIQSALKGEPKAE
ncbi:MAG: prefoldin subunit beta [Thermoplasmata archaeon HGW-Thermoplasmata-2]|nr:MAG: prefoldin subunit beta [Thermoplasmata archaeon HGW-Thermoplasmata-2]